MLLHNAQVSFMEIRSLSLFLPLDFSLPSFLPQSVCPHCPPFAQQNVSWSTHRHLLCNYTHLDAESALSFPHAKMFLSTVEKKWNFQSLNHHSDLITLLPIHWPLQEWGLLQHDFSPVSEGCVCACVCCSVESRVCSCENLNLVVCEVHFHFLSPSPAHSYTDVFISYIKINFSK